jgi:hypothetical protein
MPLHSLRRQKRPQWLQMLAFNRSEFSIEKSAYEERTSSGGIYTIAISSVRSDRIAE